MSGNRCENFSLTARCKDDVCIMHANERSYTIVLFISIRLHWMNASAKGR